MSWQKHTSLDVNLGLDPEQHKPLHLIWVRPGTFQMGSPLDEPGRDPYEDQPAFEVTLSKGFWLGRYLVTNIQWFRVMGNLAYPLTNDNANWPVSNVNWYEAMDFCEKLNRMFKEDLPDEYRFRLPTEAQWEYACRAGTQSVYYSGNTLNDLDRVAWHRENSGGHPHPVGEKEPNAWGFYDMHGNISEWCWDDFYPYPQSSTLDLVSIELRPLRFRVKIIRGGSWASHPTDDGFRCSCRLALRPEQGNPSSGFRVSLRIPEIVERQTTDPTK